VEAHPPIAQKKRCDAAFGRAKSEIDGAGFAQTRPNTGAWTPAGECHAATAVRGQRLNTIGALLSTGALLTAKRWERTTAERFAGFLGLLVEPVGKPLTAIVDNASVHTAKAIKPTREQLKQKGLTLYFLPPYSPELNRVEILWRKLKYGWLAFKTCDSKTLGANLDDSPNTSPISPRLTNEQLKFGGLGRGLHGRTSVAALDLLS
jgi:transposase